MQAQPRRCLLLETESGRRVLLSTRGHGKVSWTQGRATSGAIADPARVIRSVDCRRGRRTLRDVKRHLDKAVTSPGSSHALDDLYSFLNGVPGSRAPSVDRSVAFGDDAQILARFQEDGFVVVRDVFSEASVEAAADELWESPLLLGRSPAIRREDPATWGTDWPQQDGGRNFLESADAYADEAPWELAQSPEAAHVLGLLWRQHGVDDLVLAEAPRWGVMRPTAVNRRWGTQESWLHWDQSPWTQPGLFRAQALACVSAQTETSGGLLCAPGFHRRWAQRGRDNPEEDLRRRGRQHGGQGRREPPASARGTTPHTGRSSGCWRRGGRSSSGTAGRPTRASPTRGPTSASSCTSTSSRPARRPAARSWRRSSAAASSCAVCWVRRRASGRWG
uniref:Uncharacterized protein n=1 Tax=Alexandrium monilatum TaxID=311494 RepID=A0A7S4V8A9_9DINO|mmetsp:Transcript_21306/g.66786  ORF Transcript_21306/g.66786 Transcript_21306/m.66786 type:complete len:392 (-) Transcript_21306:102-1277(-)